MTLDARLRPLAKRLHEQYGKASTLTRKRQGVYVYDPVTGEKVYSKTFNLTTEALDPAITYAHPGGKYYEGADGLLHASAENEWPLEYRDGVAVGRTVRSAEHWYVTLQTADGDTLITADGDTLTN